jgi:hypothetical protein
MDTIIPNSWQFLSTIERNIIQQVNDYVSKSVGYVVTVHVHLTEKFGDSEQEGIINYETHNGKVFAEDIVVLKNQKKDMRLITIAHELGHMIDYYTASPAIQTQMGLTDQVTTSIDIAAGILFEAEKRAWDNAFAILNKSGIMASKKFMSKFLTEKYKSLESSIEDIYETLRKERKQKKDKKNVKSESSERPADESSPDTA